MKPLCWRVKFGVPGSVRVYSYNINVLVAAHPIAFSSELYLGMYIDNTLLLFQFSSFLGLTPITCRHVVSEGECRYIGGNRPTWGRARQAPGRAGNVHIDSGRSVFCLVS